jgi:hypothetical protein
MMFTTRELPVDTATIGIIDPDYLMDRKELRQAQVFKVPKGKYILNAKVVGAFPPKKMGIKNRQFTVTSGEVWVGDPCQMIKDSEWESWLDATKYHTIRGEQIAFIKLGADGGYYLNFTLEEPKPGWEPR